jgi:hypothetical protein
LKILRSFWLNDSIFNADSGDIISKVNRNFGYAKQINFPGTAERRERYSGGQLTRTLDQIIRKDYFCTHKALREIFVPGYNPQEFDSVVPALNWIKASSGNLDMFFKAGLNNDGLSDLPNVVRENQATISLWFELANNNNGSKDNIPVAFSVNTRAFYEDLGYLVSPRWGKLSSCSQDVAGTKDYIGEQLFRIYWNGLITRYNFVIGRTS